MLINRKTKLQTAGEQWGKYTAGSAPQRPAWLYLPSFSIQRHYLSSHHRSRKKIGCNQIENVSQGKEQFFSRHGINCTKKNINQKKTDPDSVFHVVKRSKRNAASRRLDPHEFSTRHIGPHHLEVTAKPPVVFQKTIYAYSKNTIELMHRQIFLYSKKCHFL